MKARKYLILLPVLVLAMLLTGCIQTVVKIDIHDDLSAEVDVKMGIQEDYYEMVGGDNAFSGVNTGEAEGFTVDTYSEGGYKGLETKGTIEDVTSSENYLNSMFGYDFITVGTDPDGKVSIDLNAPVSGVQGQVSSQAGYSMSELTGYGQMDMRVIITLPYEVKETNATSVSGNTLTWDLLKFDESYMTAHAVNEGGFVFPIWVLIVIIAAAAAVVVVLLLLRMKKNKAAQQGQYQPEQYQPEQYQPEQYQPEQYQQEQFQQGQYQPEQYPPEAEQQYQPEAETVVQMAFCPQCGRKLADTGAFCPGCGHKLK